MYVYIIKLPKGLDFQTTLLLTRWTLDYDEDQLGGEAFKSP